METVAPPMLLERLLPKAAGMAALLPPLIPLKIMTDPPPVPSEVVKFQESISKVVSAKTFAVVATSEIVLAPKVTAYSVLPAR